MTLSFEFIACVLNFLLKFIRLVIVEYCFQVIVLFERVDKPRNMLASIHDPVRNFNNRSEAPSAATTVFSGIKSMKKSFVQFAKLSWDLNALST